MIICTKHHRSFAFRYEYDDHYFLTDPKEFIYEFYPLQPEWQLLKEPINLEEFEELPFVRSLFFRYQLAFPSDHMKSVMPTDQTGAQHFAQAPGVCKICFGLFNSFCNLSFFSHLPPPILNIRLN